MYKDLKIGDKVKGFGFSFEPLRWYEKIYLKPKWWFKDFVYFIKKQIQKIENCGFPDEQVFDFYSYHAKYCLPRLKMFRKDLQSHPGNLTFDEWKAIIDKIIWSFESLDTDTSDLWIYPENYDDRQEVCDVSETGTTFKNCDERPIDFSKAEEFEKRQQEGFELFGKWLIHIWN